MSACISAGVLIGAEASKSDIERDHIQGAHSTWRKTEQPDNREDQQAEIAPRHQKEPSHPVAPFLEEVEACPVAESFLVRRMEVLVFDCEKYRLEGIGNRRTGEMRVFNPLLGPTTVGKLRVR